MKEQKVKWQRKILFSSKKQFGNGSFIYDVRKKVQISATHHPPLYLQASNFGKNTPHLWTFLIGIQIGTYRGSEKYLHLRKMNDP